MSSVGGHGENKEKLAKKASIKLPMESKRAEGIQDCSRNAKTFRFCPPDFCDMIGKHQERISELSKIKQDLRRRLEMEELLMPVATMISLKPGDGLPDAITGVIDQQATRRTMPFLSPNASLSQHEDIRIREVESIRKKAIKRREEAQTCLIKKKQAVAERLMKIDEAKRKKKEFEKKIKEIEEKNKEENSLDGVESLPSVQSLGPGDLDYLMKLEELVKTELATKKQLDELERRQEANMKALELAAQVMSHEKNHGELDGLKGKLEVKSSANQQLADRICELEDQVESLKSKLSKCNQKLGQYINIEKVDISVGDKIHVTDKVSMAAPEVSEMETFSEIIETKDQNVEAVPSTESLGITAEVEVTERSVQDVSIKTKDSHVEAVVNTGSLGTMTRVIEVAEKSVQEPINDNNYRRMEEVRTDDTSVQFYDLPEGLQAETLPSFIEPPLLYDTQISENDQHMISEIEINKTNENSLICLPRQELKNWLDSIWNVRKRLSENRECVSLAEPAMGRLEEAIRGHLELQFVDLPNESDVQQSSGSDWAHEEAQIQAPMSNDRDVTASHVDSYNFDTESSLEKENEIQNIDDATIISQHQAGKVMTPKQSMGFPVGTSTPITKNRHNDSNLESQHDVNDSQFNASEQSINHPIATSTPMNENRREMSDGEKHHTVNDSHSVDLTESINSPVTKSTPSIDNRQENFISEEQHNTNDSKFIASEQNMNYPIATSTPMNENRREISDGEKHHTVNDSHPVDLTEPINSPVAQSTPLTDNRQNEFNPEEHLNVNDSQFNTVTESVNPVATSTPINKSQNSVEDSQFIDSAQSINSPVGTSTPITKDREKTPERISLDTQKPSTLSVARNSLEAKNTLENVRDFSHPVRMDEIDEPMPDIEIEEIEIRRNGETNEIPNEEKSHLLSRAKEKKSQMSRGSVTMDDQPNPQTIVNSGSGSICSPIMPVIDKSTSRVSPDQNKSAVDQKMSQCICQATQRWLKITRQQYNKLKEETKKSPQGKHHSKSMKGNHSKAVSTSISTSVETQTNVYGRQDRFRRNFDCDPCDCDPCGSGNSSSDLDERKRTPQKKSQGVLAKIAKSHR